MIPRRSTVIKTADEIEIEMRKKGSKDVLIQQELLEREDVQLRTQREYDTLPPARPYRKPSS